MGRMTIHILWEKMFETTNQIMNGVDFPLAYLIAGGYKAHKNEDYNPCNDDTQFISIMCIRSFNLFCRESSIVRNGLIYGRCTKHWLAGTINLHLVRALSIATMTKGWRLNHPKAAVPWESRLMAPRQPFGAHFTVTARAMIHNIPCFHWGRKWAIGIFWVKNDDMAGGQNWVPQKSWMVTTKDRHVFLCIFSGF